MCRCKWHGLHPYGVYIYSDLDLLIGVDSSPPLLRQKKKTNFTQLPSWLAAISVKTSHVSKVPHRPCGAQCTICMQRYQTSHWGSVCLCLGLQNVFPRLTIFQTLTSCTGVGFYVCAHGTAVDWYGCHPQDCSHLPGLPLWAPFLPFQSFIHFLQYLAVCAFSFQSQHLPGRCSVSILSFMTLFSFSQFVIPFTFVTPLPPQHLCPLSSSPPSDSVHSLTQYCIERFFSLLPDLAVIVPERSRLIDFSEKRHSHVL